MYPHRYKFGKQTTILSSAEFQIAVNNAIDKGATPEQIAYCIVLWNWGFRKSEAYERVISDVVITETAVLIDAHERKKHGLQVPAVEVQRGWFGIEEYLIPWALERESAKPTKKRIFYQQPTGKFTRTKPTAQRPKGTRVEVKVRASRVEKAVWLFPHIASTSAWTAVKLVLGEKYYPHFCRLEKLSKVAKTAQNMGDMISAVRRVSGLKSLNAMEAYFGDDEEVGSKAMRESE